MDGNVTLLDHLRALPADALLPAGWLRDQLEANGQEPVSEPEVVHEVEPQTWRVRIWTCPPETRLGVVELEEALGRPRSWIYRRTSERAAAANGRHGRLHMIPHRKLGGELVFVAGDIRRWLEEHERVAVPASRRRS